MKADKFEIFAELVNQEASTNHYGTYISVGQLQQMLYQVSRIHENWVDSLNLRENVSGEFRRSVAPLKWQSPTAF